MAEQLARLCGALEQALPRVERLVHSPSADVVIAGISLMQHLHWVGGHGGNAGGMGPCGESGELHGVVCVSKCHCVRTVWSWGEVGRKVDTGQKWVCCRS